MNSKASRPYEPLSHLEYLDGKRWSEVTRDEKFFCQRLYELICDVSAEEFVRYLCEAYRSTFFS